MNPFDACATCVYCVRGQTQFCTQEAMKTARGIMKDGGWQQSIVVPAHLCYVLPPSLSFKESIFIQPFSNCIHGWDNIGRIYNESKIVVAGSGNCDVLKSIPLHYKNY